MLVGSYSRGTARHVQQEGNARGKLLMRGNLARAAGRRSKWEATHVGQPGTCSRRVMLVGSYSRGTARHVQQEDDARVADDDGDGQHPLRPDAGDVVHMVDPALFLGTQS